MSFAETQKLIKTPKIDLTGVQAKVDSQRRRGENSGSNRATLPRVATEKSYLSKSPVAPLQQ